MIPITKRNKHVFDNEHLLEGLKSIAVLASAPMSQLIGCYFPETL